MIARKYPQPTADMQSTPGLMGMMMPPAGLPVPIQMEIATNGIVRLCVAPAGSPASCRIQSQVTIQLEDVLTWVEGFLQEHIQVEELRFRGVRLASECDLHMTLYTVVRRGISAAIEMYIHLRILDDNELQLVSVRTDGYNLTGSTVRLFLNRVLSDINRRMVILFDPATQLPPSVTMYALRFTSADMTAIGMDVDVGCQLAAGG